MLLHEIVIEDWIPIVNSVVAEWPTNNWSHWHSYNDSNSKKFATKDRNRLSPVAHILLEKMVSKVCELDSSSLENCFPDFELHGAGMHMILPGGYLKPHTDSEKHPTRNWYRKYSTVLFLTECEGGVLTIENKVVYPTPGKLVTLDSSAIHSVGKVEHGKRLSLSVFWWGLEGSGDTTQAQFI